jgi:hypothetical protein
MRFREDLVSHTPGIQDLVVAFSSGSALDLALTDMLADAVVAQHRQATA